MFEIDQNELHSTTKLKSAKVNMGNIVQLVQFNRKKYNMFTAAVSNHINIVDFEHQKIVHSSAYEDWIQTFSWNRCESQIVTNTKNRTIQINDIRAQSEKISGPSHQSIRDVKVIWLGNENYILSSGKPMKVHISFSLIYI